MRAGINPNCELAYAALDRRFASRDSQLSVEVQKHLDGCESCRALYSYFADEFHTDSVPGELESKIVRTLQGSIEPVPRLPSTAAIVAQIVIVFLLITVALTSLMTVVGIHVMTVPQLIGVSTVLCLGVGLVALLLAWQMRPGSLRRISEWASAGTIAAGLVIIIVLLFPWKTSDQFVVRGWHCLRAGLALTLPVGLVFGYLARRGAPVSLGSVGGAVGAIAGLLSMTVLQYTCDLQNIGHLLVWHGSVLVTSTLAGVLVSEGLDRFLLGFR